MTIEGRETRFIQPGSVLELTCQVHHPRRRPPDHLLWFRGSERLDYNSPCGGVSVQVRKLSYKFYVASNSFTWVQSKLLIVTDLSHFFYNTGRR